MFHVNSLTDDKTADIFQSPPLMVHRCEQNIYQRYPRPHESAIHLRNVGKKVPLQESRKDDLDSTVSQHFNTGRYSITEITATGLLSYAPSKSTRRKTAEKSIIFKLGTQSFTSAP